MVWESLAIEAQALLSRGKLPESASLSLSVAHHTSKRENKCKTRSKETTSCRIYRLDHFDPLCAEKATAGGFETWLKEAQLHLCFQCAFLQFEVALNALFAEKVSTQSILFRKVRLRS